MNKRGCTTLYLHQLSLITSSIYCCDIPQNCFVNSFLYRPPTTASCPSSCGNPLISIGRWRPPRSGNGVRRNKHSRAETVAWKNVARRPRSARQLRGRHCAREKGLVRRIQVMISFKDPPHPPLAHPGDPNPWWHYLLMVSDNTKKRGSCLTRLYKKGNHICANLT